MRVCLREEIDSLRSKQILEVKEKLELCDKIRELETDIQDRERVADELSAELEDGYWEEN